MIRELHVYGDVEALKKVQTPPAFGHLPFTGEKNK